MKKIFFTVITILLIAIGSYSLLSTDKKKLENSPSKINIIVSVLPQVDFVERIGGEKVIVNEMIPPGFSPATYDPSPDQLKKLQDAQIYFRIGHIPFEETQMDKLIDINQNMMVVDTSSQVPLLEVVSHGYHEDDEEEHEHEEGDDPHIWLSPKLVKIQAESIYQALVKHSPNDQNYFKNNYDQFISDLDNLDQKLEFAFSPIKDQTILVFHPAFGYLADVYGFKQQAIEIEGKEPTPAQLQEIIDQAKQNDVKVIFVQTQFSTKSAESVAQAIKGVVVQIDPLAKDYFNNLESMADIIVTSMK